MTEQSKTRIPAPFYAAAGAGDLAYEQLRRLPAVVTELREKATAGGVDLRHRAAETRTELRERAEATRTGLRERAAATLKAANETATDLRGKATAEFDLEHLREAARRNAQAMLADAKAVQVRAVEVYHQLVARGERVVGSGVVEAAETVNADIEATEAQAEVAAVPADTPEVAEPADAETGSKTGPKAAKTAVKRTRPAIRK